VSESYNQQECDDDLSHKYIQQECDNDITIADETMAYIEHLEERNALLHKRVIELECESADLTSQVKSLDPELARLKLDDNSTKRKHRVDQENAELSHQLSIVIHNFLTNSHFFPTEESFQVVDLQRLLSTAYSHLNGRILK
jgi:chromosome segregation ATPase